MSYYDEASLVMIPSGYKTSKVYSIKPTDGSGDLAFTRSNDTATRVGPDGLIEKVRTNLLTYSQDFTNAAWTKSNVSATGGQTDPNGGTTASLIQTTTASSAYIYQAQTGAKAFSIYAKAGTKSNFAIINGLYNQGAGFNLSTQTVTNAGAGSLAKIEDVGGGWYRCSVYMSSAVEMLVMLADVSGGGMVVGDNLYFAFAQAETGDIATDYIATTTAAVSVGPVANVPRLDYLGSSCPRLLLEPQRTNLLLQSNTFTTTWAMFAGPAVNPNSTTSPDGSANATTLNSSGGGNDFLYQSLSGLTVSTTYTFSFYVKNLNSTGSRIWGPSQGATTIDINWSGSTLSSVSGAGSSFASVGNGWYRVVVTEPATVSTPIIRIYADKTNSSKSIYIYGTQLEQGAYATSYIPTLGAAVTRGADAASKTGISSLIGQTQGTIFVDFQLNQAPSDVNGRLLQLWATSDTTDAIIPLINQSNQLQVSTYNSSSGAAIIIASASTLLGLGQNKIAVAYTSTSVVVYRNGVLFASGNPTGYFPTSLTSLDLGGSSSAARNLGNPINQAILFKTRLSNADLAALTA